MLNIFLKDLRQNLFITVICIFLPFLSPLISLIFFKDNYEDAKNIIYLLLLFVFIPAYMMILSSSILKNENIRLLKIIAISNFKIIFSKFIYIIFSCILLSLIYFSFLDFERVGFLGGGKVLTYLIFIYIILLISFLSFSFSNLFEKEIANFIVLLIISTNIFAFYFVYSKKTQYLLIAYEIYYIYFLIFAFAIMLIFLSGNYKLKEQKIGIFKFSIIILLLLFPAIYIISNQNKWTKESILANSYKFSVNEEEILISEFFNGEFYSYNLKTGKLLYLPNLSKMKISYFNQNLFYLKTYGYRSRFCDKQLYTSLYYSYNPFTNKLKKIGKYPISSFFKDKIVCWYDWEKDKNGNNCLIGFKNEEKNTCFYDSAFNFDFLKEGVIYKKNEENLKKIYYADYDNSEKKEILNGIWEIKKGSLSYYFCDIFIMEKIFNRNYTYVSKEKNYYRLYLPSGELKDLGNLIPLADFENGNLLAYEIKDKEIDLYFLKNDEVIKKSKLQLMYIWAAYIFSEKLGSFNYKNKDGYGVIIFSIENNNLKLYHLPKGIADHCFLKKDGELIITKEKRVPFFKERTYLKAYLYNFKTGKERPL